MDARQAAESGRRAVLLSAARPAVQQLILADHRSAPRRIAVEKLVDMGSVQGALLVGRLAR